MRKFLILINALFLLSFCSCFPNENIEVEEETIGETVSDDSFFLSIVVENPETEKGEAMICYATVTYMGSEKITIYHSDPLVVFGIEGGYFENEFIRQDELLSTEFEPEEEIRFEFTKTGSWEADGPNAAFYEEFCREEELILPEGEYALSANIKYSTDKDDLILTLTNMTVSVKVESGG
jgi:hypothetical protein